MKMTCTEPKEALRVGNTVSKESAVEFQSTNYYIKFTFVVPILTHLKEGVTYVY